MDSILFEVLRVIVIVLVALVVRYLIPWLKLKIGESKTDEITRWVNTAVLMAQQVYYAKSGPERKAIVVDLLHDLLTAKNISISDEQLDALIEAAVKTMKMNEDKNIVTFNTSVPSPVNEATEASQQ